MLFAILLIHVDCIRKTSECRSTTAMSSVSELRIMLVGASGLTGQSVLRLLLADERVKEVHTPHRGPSSIDHPNLRPHPWQENPPRFDSLPDIPFDVVLCCLGTTLKKAGSRQAFQNIDRDAVLDLGAWARRRGVSRMLVISSAGSNPDSANFYLRTKGEMEAGLRLLKIPSITIFRPGLLLGNRKELRPAERLGQWALPLLSPLLRGPLLGWQGTPVETLARLMVARMFDPQSGFHVVENRDILDPGLKRS
jgi:uncharacterized protein YbjT (DUF2867 family)